MVTYFVTLNWNTTGLLMDMVGSVEVTTPEPHVWVIVDNGSDEENEAALYWWVGQTFKDPVVIRQDFSYSQTGELESVDAIVVHLPENQGCIKGHNLAFDIARLLNRGELYEIVMIDTDVVVLEEGWLSSVRRWAGDRPNVGIVGLEHGPNAVCAPAVFLDTNGNWYLHETQMKKAVPAEGESVGLGFALLRWPVVEAGLRFDTNFVMYYKQDDDFCFQVRADLGLEVWVYPVENIHFGSGSLRANEYQVGEAKGWDEFDEVKQKNQAYFTKKWRWALEDRRRNMEEQAAWLLEMKETMAERRQGDTEMGGQGEGMAAQDVEGEGPSREVLERMVQEELTPVPELGELLPSDAELRRTMRRLREILPEMFEDEPE